MARLLKSYAALVCVLLGGATFGCASDGRHPKVVCIGDSITAGEGVKRRESFVSLLAGATQWTTLNQGRSGWSTSTYLARRQAVVAAVPADADMVLILLGTNDLLGGHTETTVPNVASHIDQLTDLVHQRAPKAEIVLMTPVSVFPSSLSVRLRQAGFDEQAPLFLKRMGDALRGLARRKGYRAVDLYSAVTADNTLDGVHPNAAGHRQIAEAILGALVGRSSAH